MHIQNIGALEFSNFANRHPLSIFYQTLNLLRYGQIESLIKNSNLLKLNENEREKYER